MEQQIIPEDVHNTVPYQENNQPDTSQTLDANSETALDEKLEACEIDQALRPLIKDLWQNGWQTDYSCQGEVGGHRYTPGYLSGMKPDGTRFTIRFHKLPADVEKVKSYINHEQQFCSNPNHRNGGKFCADCGMIGHTFSSQKEIIN